jgi:hypothetical protein
MKTITFEYNSTTQEWSFVYNTMRHSGFETFIDAATDFNKLAFEEK